jgi:ribosomal protein S18 acetylase RimI-like enzyme
MRRRDLKRVMTIEQAVFPEPWSLTIFTSELALREGRAYRVARAGRMVVGYFGLMFVDDEAHVTTVAVAPDHQHRGIGTTLMLDAVGTSRWRWRRVTNAPRRSTGGLASRRWACARATTSSPVRTPS